MNEQLIDSAATPKVSIDWYRATPWWRLASQSLVISWRASHLLFCAAGVLASYVAIYAANGMFGTDPTSFIQWDLGWVASTQASTNPIEWMYHQKSISPMIVWTVLVSRPLGFVENPNLRELAKSLTILLAFLAIWSFVGGCIARRSLIELGTRLTAPWNVTVGLVSKRWLSIVWSILMPIALIAIVCLLPLTLGALSHIPWIGQPIALLLMIPIILLSIGLGWCGAISLLGFPFSMCAVVSETRADAFDGVSRSAAYIFQRPLTLILCVAAFELIGTLGSKLVGVVLTLGYASVTGAFSLIGAPKLAIDSESTGLTWLLLEIITSIVPLLILSFGFSFFWTASAATYLILRKDVDNTEFDQIDLDEPKPSKPLPEITAVKPESDPASES